MAEHPDKAVAYEEIARYYEDRVAEAQAAVDKALAELRERLGQQAAWNDRGEITAPGVNQQLALKMEIAVLVSHSVSRFQRAAGAVIAGRSDRTVVELRAEALALGAREEALRRWLTAQGYDLGAMALPEPKGRRHG